MFIMTSSVIVLLEMYRSHFFLKLSKNHLGHDKCIKQSIYCTPINFNQCQEVITITKHFNENKMTLLAI